MERLLHKVKETINKYNMIEKGDCICLTYESGTAMTHTVLCPADP